MDFTANSLLRIDLNQIPPPDLPTAATTTTTTPRLCAVCATTQVHSLLGYHWLCRECVDDRVNTEFSHTHHFRKQTVADNSIGVFGAPIAYSNLHNRSAFEDMIDYTRSLIKSFEKSLRDFISEWRDELKDGWYVEIRQSVSSFEVYAVYCAPDGKTFYSLYEVACYLRQMSGHSSVESEIRNEESGGPQISRKRKAPKTLVDNGFAEKRGTLINSYCIDPPSDGLSPPSDGSSVKCAPVVGNIQKANEAEIRRNEDGHSSPEQSALLAEVSDAKDSSENLSGGDVSIPEWAMELEPARKLPTNVGTRIRRCIYNALEKNPPEWAKKVLLHSISKEVFKGNASGPTKKAVLSVLAKVSDELMRQKPPDKRRK
ncbi:unnamed protein product [Lupinus luteus]|uniref:MBD domain-containing protein n=1 Tax=Lupinus luteus TaxID=3873 RepID=A0AAV1XMR2_LUPLU